MKTYATVIQIKAGWATVQLRNGFTFDCWLYSADLRVDDKVEVT